ncbi:hypothetical protein NHX12_000744 [Muraenolepis orangiensis]|uniref:Protein NDRG2 n=1 Tax=Muraenolepis orangiensis TaxID=630683 RepID=A0A9Q0E1R3_9TELE|nr:hypothetical protein NHX12_000744 [Muraenolepis orangiensis]
MVLDDNEDDSVFELQITEQQVDTLYGKVYCTIAGLSKPNCPVILTYHDVGLNHKMCFESFFSHEDMQEIIRHFPVLHVNAPGQHEGAVSLATEYIYPSMDQLSETLPTILKHFGFTSVIGFGVGAGANILTRFALNYPDLIEGLVLININPNAEGIVESVTSKITGWTQTVTETVIAHLFGKKEIESHHDVIATFRHDIMTYMNESNLAQFMRSYNSRQALELKRPVPGTNHTGRTLKCSSLLIAGDDSPWLEVVVDCNSKLDPTRATLLKMADCGGLPQVDQPAKLTEALKYFVQGLGYMSSSCMTRLSRSRTTSTSSVMSTDSGRARAHTDELQRGLWSAHRRARSHTDSSVDGISTNHTGSKPERC